MKLSQLIEVLQRQQRDLWPFDPDASVLDPGYGTLEIDETEPVKPDYVPCTTTEGLQRCEVYIRTKS